MDRIKIKHRWLRRHLGPKHWWLHDVASEAKKSHQSMGYWAMVKQLQSATKNHQRSTNINQLPSGYVKIAIENGHRNSEFSH